MRIRTASLVLLAVAALSGVAAQNAHAAPAAQHHVTATPSDENRVSIEIL